MQLHRLLRLCVLCLLPLAANAGDSQQSVGIYWGTPRIGLAPYQGQTQFRRAISLCTEVDRRLPVQHPVRLDEPGDMEGRLVMQLLPLGPAPAGLRIHRGDIASGTLLEQTPTRIVLRGWVWDAELLLETSAVVATGTGHAVYTATFCNWLDMCTELRDRIEFVSGTDRIETTHCDEPPELRREDDDGERNYDDHTSAQPLRFDIQSSAASVTLLRDGVPIDSGSVVNGRVTLLDASAPTYTIHAYQAVHGTGLPSARRYVERYRAGYPLFSNGFEAAN